MQIKINNREFEVGTGTSVASAVMNSGFNQTRGSVTGEPRLPFCGMGICYECRVAINGVAYERSCLVMCEEGMEINTP